MPEPITPPQAAPDTSRGQRVAAAGMLLNLLLAIIKLIVGLVGRSYALTADAVESMVDVVGSAVIWGGLHIAAKPADEEHPYGHGKAEALAALMVAMLIAAAGLGIAVKAVAELVQPTPGHTPRAYTLWVLITVIVVKLVVFAATRNVARGTGSQAVRVEAWHHVSDAISSFAALIGVAAAVQWGYQRADDIAALIAASVVMLNAAALVRAPVRELMDAEPADVVDEVRRIASAVPGVVRTEKMAARTSAGKIRVDMHLHVDPNIKVLEAHEISHRVKDAVMARMPRVADVLVHIEPADPPAGA